MNALFEIGQKVVCVDSSGTNSLIEGKTYTVMGIKKLSCCGCVEINVGIKTNSGIHICSDCGESSRSGLGWRKQTRFVPLDFDRQADEEIRESLNREKVII